MTPQVLQRKRARLALKKKWSAKSKAAAAEYEQMLAARAKAKRAEQEGGLLGGLQRIVARAPDNGARARAAVWRGA